MDVITIDGPSAAGKGTIGSKLSQRLGCYYLDSGLLYRQLAAWALEAGVDLTNEAAVCDVITVKLSNVEFKLEPSDKLRSSEVSDAASKIGVLRSVRERANQYQRDYVEAAEKSIIIDGRDAGTVVFPDAKFKLFITATPDVRAKRRYDQLVERGYAPADLKSLEEEIVQRDLRDQKREIAPLKAAPDAYIIDTTEETADESVQRILKYLEKYLVTC
ncbi:(d)CMP kinase [Candidatus Bodocaedibacter vickermanii]|uniref:Cytidylate kinase n=1 Tax=Candidatus Bodocaedibacter vickermanii TaxID=2741701 RepID=A0A7L9RUD2_9PROT|nr:Cytidylate kinase [Candidatus Paracaedibacteraceae bacterium 'Lake Konstanz']